MAENSAKVVYASTIQEVLYYLKNTQSLHIFAGATLCKKNAHSQKIQLPKMCIFIGHIDELKEITKTERYIDFGASVTINQILELGKNRIPHFLYEAALSIASHNVGNIATLGGNICNSNHKMSLYAPLLALDASIELRNAFETKHVVLSKLANIPPGFLLTKIRVPVADWYTSSYVKLGSPYEQNEKSASYTFLADSSKGTILDDLRIAFAGEIAFRSRDLENTLIGARLPLSERDCLVILDKASKLYDEEADKANKKINLLIKSQFLSLLEQSLDELKHF